MRDISTGSKPYIALCMQTGFNLGAATSSWTGASGQGLAGSPASGAQPGFGAPALPSPPSNPFAALAAATGLAPASPTTFRASSSPRFGRAALQTSPGAVTTWPTPPKLPPDPPPPYAFAQMVRLVRNPSPNPARMSMSPSLFPFQARAQQRHSEVRFILFRRGISE